MRFIEIASQFLHKLQAFGRGSEGFTCGSCVRWESCGLLPDDNCLEKVIQTPRPAEMLSRRSILRPPM